MVMLSLPSLSRRFSLSMAALDLAAVATFTALPGTAVATQRTAELVSIQGSAVNLQTLEVGHQHFLVGSRQPAASRTGCGA